MTPDFTPILIGLCVALIIAAGTLLACMALSEWWRSWQRRRLR